MQLDNKYNAVFHCFIKKYLCSFLILTLHRLHLCDAYKTVIMKRKDTVTVSKSYQNNNDRQ